MFSPILQVFHRLLHCLPFCFSREQSRTQCLGIGQQSCANAYAYANHVLTGNNNNISIRKTQGSDILMLMHMLMHMLMSQLSTLVHKMLMLMLMLVLLVRTGLKVVINYNLEIYITITQFSSCTFHFIKCRKIISVVLYKLFLLNSHQFLLLFDFINAPFISSVLITATIFPN